MPCVNDYNNEPARRQEFREDLREFRREIRDGFKEFRQEIKQEIKKDLEQALAPIKEINNRLTSLEKGQASIEKGQKFIYWALSGILAINLVVLSLIGGA